jgi:hypothetical protein
MRIKTKIRFLLITQQFYIFHLELNIVYLFFVKHNLKQSVKMFMGWTLNLFSPSPLRLTALTNRVNDAHRRDRQNQWFITDITNNEQSSLENITDRLNDLVTEVTNKLSDLFKDVTEKMNHTSQMLPTSQIPRYKRPRHIKTLII